MVEGDVETGDAGIGNKAVGRFMTDDPGERSRNANGTALIAPERDVDLSGGRAACRTVG